MVRGYGMMIRGASGAPDCPAFVASTYRKRSS
jgi:hypothetical protein